MEELGQRLVQVMSTALVLVLFVWGFLEAGLDRARHVLAHDSQESIAAHAVGYPQPQGV